MTEHAADEDGRRRGALRDRGAGLVLDLHRSARSTGSEELFSIRIPDLLSFLATGDLNGKVEGINDLQAAYQAARTARATTCPNVPVTYWTFRLMIGFGALAAAGRGLVAVVPAAGPTADRPARRRGRRSSLPFLPLLANSLGWIFTEMGRQPWIVFGLMQTSAGVSPGDRPRSRSC